MSRKYVIWGGTGNYKVLKEILDNNKGVILALFDNDPDFKNPYPEVPFIGGEDQLGGWLSLNRDLVKQYHFVATMGGGHGKTRLMIYDLLLNSGLKPTNIIHSTAFVAQNADLGNGNLIFANSTVCSEARIGNCCIINTAASVDHECILEDGVTIGPGARLAGLVQVGRYADIYTGAIILPRIKIGEGAVVGAGAVVLKDVEPYSVVAGNPARIIKRRG